MARSGSATRPASSGPCDVALFRAGTWATWQVEHHVRKLAFYHQQVPAPLARGLVVLRRLRALLRQTGPGGATGLVALARRRLTAGVNMGALLPVAWLA